jgi:hypothetical protein
MGPTPTKIYVIYFQDLTAWYGSGVPEFRPTISFLSEEEAMNFVFEKNTPTERYTYAAINIGSWSKRRSKMYDKWFLRK